MWKNKSNIFWALFSVGFFSLSFANHRVFKQLPLYPLDYVAGAIILLGIYFFFKSNNELSFFRETKWYVLTGFITAAFFSWGVNNPTLTGLGQLKSWIVLPGVASFLAAPFLLKTNNRDKTFFEVLFVGLVFLLALLLPFLFLGIYTFDGRLQGLFTSPNFLAFFLTPGTLLSIYFYRSSKSLFEKCTYMFFIILFLFTLYETHSFGAWFSLLCALIWYFFSATRFSIKKCFPVMFGILFLSAVFIGAELEDNTKLRTVLEERSSLSSRVTIWTVAKEVIKDNPFLGIGIGRFQEVYLSYQKYFPPYLEWAVPQPHNIFLAVWLQTGVAGLILFLWLLRKAFEGVFSVENSRERVLLQCLLISALIYGIFDTPLFGNALAFYFWTIIGMLIFSEKRQNKNS